jgi:hypothetical protein
MESCVGRGSLVGVFLRLMAMTEEGRKIFFFPYFVCPGEE